MALEPARSIIERFGGPSALAGILGVHRTRVSNWQRERLKGGTGGLIPQRYHPTLLSYAGQHGIVLEPGDFLPTPPTAPEDSIVEAEQVQS
jgi:hypothetical protein